ncbi:hypothetical protein CJ179_01675 [Rhodococcus sp. ACS1]|uniref:site-specific integrase n=1 Tax=Rhodococcus sp. ACS1 TaxID=2028570 RepID=UPI000BB14237|nr:hypothetical protein CJ179_01675 [Rhodococcus sp. ACS1]
MSRWSVGVSSVDGLSAVLTLVSVTNATAGPCRSQRLVLADGERTWTVVGRDYLPVAPAEKYLEYLRVQRNSPSTVKSYARALALWWEYLSEFDRDWRAVTLEDFGGFLCWLRTEDGPDVVSIAPGRARFAESTIAVRLRAVLAFYSYQQHRCRPRVVSDRPRPQRQIQTFARAHRPASGSPPGGDPG